jgi:hypothetical protein
LVYVPKVDFAELVSKLHIFSTTASTVTTVALLIVFSRKLFSDIHTPLSLKVTCAEKPNDVTQKDETPGTEKIKQWDNEKLKIFVENIGLYL